MIPLFDKAVFLLMHVNRLDWEWISPITTPIPPPPPPPPPPIIPLLKCSTYACMHVCAVWLCVRYAVCMLCMCCVVCLCGSTEHVFVCLCLCICVHMCVCVQQIYATCLCDCMGNVLVLANVVRQSVTY